MFLPFKDSEFWAFLNSNGQGQSSIYEGIEDQLIIEISEAVDWDSIDAFLNQYADRHVVCGFSYELKGDIEKLDAVKRSQQCTFPKLFLIVPKNVGYVEERSFLINWESGVKKSKDELLHKSLSNILPPREKVKIRPRFSEQDYIDRAKELLAAIQAGDIYEVNFCQQFVAEEAQINPWHVYKELNQKTKAPYSTCIKYGEKWLLSASPELFLQRDKNLLRSAPIKGTIARSTHEQEDLDLAKTLADSTKERAENIMIVDLVRNDLSRIAKKGTVEVKELCAIKSFETEHHMVSTIEAEIDKDLPFSAIIKACFPMGSMTGAPKISAMNLADKAEGIYRGIYSGAVGYIKPGGDFTLNVVIRSIVYDSAKNYLSFHTGSALTAACDPQYEYKECLLKAKALIESLNGTLDFTS